MITPGLKYLGPASVSAPLEKLDLKSHFAFGCGGRRTRGEHAYS